MYLRLRFSQSLQNSASHTFTVRITIPELMAPALTAIKERDKTRCRIGKDAAGCSAEMRIANADWQMADASVSHMAALVRHREDACSES